MTEKKPLSKGGTERPWRPLWANDLWGSANFRSLPIFGKGIYDIVWSLCRDGKYAGMLCEPNGNVWTMEYIILAMVPQQGDRKDRIKENIRELIKRGMLYLQDMDTKEIIDHNDPTNQAWLDGKCSREGLVLVVRKYAEKSVQTHVEISGDKGDSISHLIKMHGQFCPSDSHDKARREFQSAITSGIPANKIEQAIYKYKGQHCWEIISQIRKETHDRKTDKGIIKPDTSRFKKLDEEADNRATEDPRD